jgi:hypothetical protein
MTRLRLPTKTLSLLALTGALVVAAPVASAAARTVEYKGKTSSGQPITFKLRGNKIVNPVAGVGTSCLPIQGLGNPTTGVDLMNPLGWIRVGDHVKFWTKQKPHSYYNEVQINQEFSSQRGPRGAITGKLRMQYQFLIPKYPIGTFSIFSCLGTATFKATPKR